MYVKSLEGIRFEVALDDLYIKPFYDKKDTEKIDHYSVCTNQSNVEFELGKYSDKSICKHMLHLLSLYENGAFDGNLETEAIMLTEVQLCQDMYTAALFKFERAKKAYMEGVKNNG